MQRAPTTAVELARTDLDPTKAAMVVESTSATEPDDQDEPDNENFADADGSDCEDSGHSMIM
jgi:hypothetical protein